ncbi:MAG: 2Fe-2S iron-sulfur cluster-binding protein [Oscillospiraceae bacterium]|nr:2Fe-2S iron-sulfur cluster-binding protein [Oscillospiraceae bacterium]
MVNLTIDGCAVSVPEGTTILEAARTVNINIPTLCHHDDLDVKAACRICVVEVNGGAVLQPACETLVAEGLDVKTATPRVIKYRRNILELIFARHPQDCLTCRKNDL